VYYTTVSRAIKKVEREDEKWYCKTWPHNIFKKKDNLSLKYLIFIYNW
jgi:hypothetical protein